MVEGDGPEDFGMPSLKTEEGRDEWIDQLVEYDEWDCDAVVARDGDDMILKLRYPDGSQVIMDCLVRRELDIVDKAPDGEEN